MEKNTKAQRSTFAVLFYLNTSKRKKDGTCPIVGRITCPKWVVRNRPPHIGNIL